MQRLIHRIPATQYDLRDSLDRFTIREVAAHLADWEPIFFERMRQTVEQPGSAVVGIDEGQRAIDQNYAATDPVQEIARFAELRRATVAWLRERASADWDATVTHRSNGPMTLADQATMLLGHDMYHVEQLTEALA